MDLKSRRKLAIIIAIVVIVAVIGGYFTYQLSLQPNVQVTNTSFATLNHPIISMIVNDGRVSRTDSFSYTAAQRGIYTMVFDNSFSILSTKSVELTYLLAGKNQQLKFEVPPGNSRTVNANVEKGNTVSGSFNIAGGSGNDVNFSILSMTCSQTVNFQFTVVNVGNANGFAVVTLLVDGKPSGWSNKYHASKGSQLPESGTFTVDDCEKHNFSLDVTQSKA